MRLFLILSLTLCAACGTDPAAPLFDLPDRLTRPVAPPDRVVETVADAAALIVDYDAALATANGRLSAIGKIVACNRDRGLCPGGGGL